MQGIYLISLLLIIPAVTAAVMLFLKNQSIRKYVVCIASAAMIISAVLLCIKVLTEGNFLYSSNSPIIGISISLIDAITLIATLYFGIKFKEWKIILPTAAQIIAVIYLEFFSKPEGTENIINLDNLSLIMLMIVSVIGPLVAIFAIGYMKQHDAHKKQQKSHQHIFFAVIYAFLFAMNMICISDNLMHLYAFWEVTTLCSFLLIGYDRTCTSFKSAKTQLWINSIGGFFFAAGIILIEKAENTVAISSIIKNGSGAGIILTAGIMFICCSGFVKAAQFPFQPWLLGAMVAPTPVSALLHSSTMVKAGVYVIVRFSPLFAGKITGTFVALVGAFTFVSAAALAISQSNGKRVLAYSTISNLGLIITCAGIGGWAGTTAAMLLMIYHAVSKGLLFLCVGTVELKIGSRNIEDMYGIISKMPFTSAIMILGMSSMMLPPFGVLLTKWLAIEAAVQIPVVMVLLILGSAFTVAFWAKWLGAVSTVYKTDKPKIEDIPASIKFTLGTIALFIPVLTVMIPEVYTNIVLPAVSQLFNIKPGMVAGIGGIWLLDENGIKGGFGGIIVLLGLIVFAALVFAAANLLFKPKIVAPYACGALNDDEGKTFVGPQDKIESVKLHNYYFSNIFGEQKLSPVISVISTILILIMFGVS